jgi:hypothetical protein
MISDVLWSAPLFFMRLSVNSERRIDTILKFFALRFEPFQHVSEINFRLANISHVFPLIPFKTRSLKFNCKALARQGACLANGRAFTVLCRYLNMARLNGTEDAVFI